EEEEEEEEEGPTEQSTGGGRRGDVEGSSTTMISSSSCKNCGGLLSSFAVPLEVSARNLIFLTFICSRLQIRSVILCISPSSVISSRPVKMSSTSLVRVSCCCSRT
ncbi:hypothetical protein PMAYCL1PPCAC_29744, partial [Pristionchus mayeri]